MDKLSEKYNIRKINEKYCLDDIAVNIIGSKNKYNYLSNTKNKEKIGKKYFITEDFFQFFIQKIE